MTKPTLEQLFQEYLFECEYSKKLRPATLKGYREVFMLLVKLVPDVEIESLSSQTVIRFFKVLEHRRRIVSTRLIKTGVKKSTIATYWSKLSSFCNWLERQNYIDRNPFKSLSFPSPTYDDKKFLKKAEVEKIIAAIINTASTPFILKRNLLLIYLFLFCGLRRGELLGLQLRDIDLDKKLITIRKETSKAGRSRTLPLHHLVAVLLSDYLRERDGYSCQFLLVSQTGDHALSPDGLKHIVHKIVRVSCVQFHVHQLRHTFAINFLLSSGNLAKLKELLGHKNILMTMQYLRCLPPSEFKADINALRLDAFI